MTGEVAVVERLLPAPCDVVFDEWLSPHALMDWMCPRPARLRRVEIDPRVGGTLTFDIEEDGRSMLVVGTYLTLDRPREIRFTWSCSTWTDPTVQSIVAVELRPVGDSETLMTIRHSLLPPERVADHAHGWAAIATQLTAVLVSRARG